MRRIKVLVMLGINLTTVAFVFAAPPNDDTDAWKILNPPTNEHIAKGATFDSNGEADMNTGVVVKFYKTGSPDVLEGSFTTTTPPQGLAWSGTFTPGPNWAVGDHKVKLYKQSDNTYMEWKAVVVDDI